jgi:hypothetical protein
MLQIPVQDLRRVAASLQRLRGQVIDDCIIRSDLKQLKIELAGGRLIVIGIETDEHGRQHRLTVDIAARIEDVGRQLDVGLDAESA